MPGPSKVGATAQDLHAIGTGRDPVHCDDGMPMGGEPRGFDAGKRIKGRKRHIITDTQGNLLSAIAHPSQRSGSGRRAGRRHFGVTSAEAWLLIASTRQLVRRIGRSANVRS